VDLFKAVSKTLLEFGQTRLKGTLGIVAVLHTWDQTLKDHFHLHCLVPAGALSFDQSRWIAARKNFLFSVKALSRVFRGKFLGLLLPHIEREKLKIKNEEVKNAGKKNWIVYAKKPFGSPQTVLDYLGRYTHRVASSVWLVLFQDGRNVFFWPGQSFIRATYGSKSLFDREAKECLRKKRTQLVCDLTST